MRETVNEDFVLLGGTELTQCEECVYLGGVVSADGFCDRDVDRRIGMAAGIIRNLHSIWKAIGYQQVNESTSILVNGPVDCSCITRRAGL